MTEAAYEKIAEGLREALIIARRREGALAVIRSDHALQAQEAEIEPGGVSSVQAAQEAGKLPSTSR